MARCQGLRRSLGSQSQGKARRGWCKANCARHRCPWGPASQRAKAEVWRATCPGPASSLHPTRPAPNPRRVAFQSHNLFGRAIFNRDRSLLRFPLQPHGAPSRLLEQDGEGRAAPARTAAGGRTLPASPPALPAARVAPRPPGPPDHPKRAGAAVPSPSRRAAWPARAGQDGHRARGRCPRWADHLQHPQEPAGSGHGSPRHGHVSPSVPCLPSWGAPAGKNDVPERQKEGRAFP